MEICIHQIYYDENSEKKLDKEFIPLKNFEIEKKDWFEFWPILKFFRENSIKENTWYGFLSPRFKDKVGIDGKTLKEIIKTSNKKAEILLASPEWDQIAYFRNVFEQGEFCHSGLIKHTENFIKKINIKINLNEMVTDSSNSVFSNYIIAKSQYWKQWKYLAEKFYEFTKEEQIKQTKNEGKFYNGYPIKVFIQERFPAIIMSLIKLPTVNIDLSNVAPINLLLFDDNIQTRNYLRECDELKKKYNQTKDDIFLNEYQSIRSKIWFKNPTL